MFNPDPKKPRIKLKRNSIAWKNLVLEVFTRDNFRCYWCGHKFTFEYLAPCHIVSVGAGGDDAADNLRTGCKMCHGKDHGGEFLKEKYNARD